MDRRDFLKLFALSAAGLYIPKTSYFFMPRVQRWIVDIDLSMMSVSPCAVKVLIAGQEYVLKPNSVLYTLGRGI